MTNSATRKRLDKIDVQLTPKQWAIRLADEIRRYPSEEGLSMTIAEGTFRQSPFVAPFFKLGEQAQDLWPGRSSEDIRARLKLNRELRGEFQALKLLINNINEVIKTKAETNKLKAARQLSKLHTMILQDALVRSGVTETMPAGLARPMRLRLPSLLEEWADIAFMQLMEMVAYKAALQRIQERYFENHPILYKDIEMAFEKTIQAIRDSIALFNEYRKVADAQDSRGSDVEQQTPGTANAMPPERESKPPIDIEGIGKRADMFAGVLVHQWIVSAIITAKGDILRETGKHEEYWQNVLKQWSEARSPRADQG